MIYTFFPEGLSIQLSFNKWLDWLNVSVSVYTNVCVCVLVSVCVCAHVYAFGLGSIK